MEKNLKKQNERNKIYSGSSNKFLTKKLFSKVHFIQSKTISRAAIEADQVGEFYLGLFKGLGHGQAVKNLYFVCWLKERLNTNSSFSKGFQWFYQKSISKFHSKSLVMDLDDIFIQKYSI